MTNPAPIAGPISHEGIAKKKAKIWKKKEVLEAETLEWVYLSMYGYPLNRLAEVV